MTENPKDIPMEAFDIVDMSKRKRDFDGNIAGLYNEMIGFNLCDPTVYLGRLYGFDLIYDGIILSLGSLEMDEKAAKTLRDDVLGENFQGDAFGNPLGTPGQLLVQLGTTVVGMWSVPVSFINWPNHFQHSPDVVFECLDELGKHLQEYRRKVSGLDKMRMYDSSFRDLDGFRTSEDAKRLEIPFANKLDVFFEPSEGEEGTPLPDSRVSDQQVAKRLSPFSKFLNNLNRKTS